MINLLESHLKHIFLSFLNMFEHLVSFVVKLYEALRAFARYHLPLSCSNPHDILHPSAKSRALLVYGLHFTMIYFVTVDLVWWRLASKDAMVFRKIDRKYISGLDGFARDARTLPCPKSFTNLIARSSKLADIRRRRKRPEVRRASLWRTCLQRRV